MAANNKTLFLWKIKRVCWWWGVVAWYYCDRNNSFTPISRHGRKITNYSKRRPFFKYTWRHSIYTQMNLLVKIIQWLAGRPVSAQLSTLSFRFYSILFCAVVLCYAGFLLVGQVHWMYNKERNSLNFKKFYWKTIAKEPIKNTLNSSQQHC